MEVESRKAEVVRTLRSAVFPVVALCAAAFSGTVPAQGYPSKPIRLILPFAPGSPGNMVGRTIGQKMGAKIAQSAGLKRE